MGLNEFESDEEFEDGIQVYQGEWKIIPKGSHGATFGLGPCVGIIIYDKRKKEAILAHLPEPIDGFKNVIEVARSRFNPNDMKICVGGGAAFYATLASCLANRKLIEQELRTLTSESNIDIKWQNFDQSTDMSVDTLTGEIVRDTQDD